MRKVYKFQQGNAIAKEALFEDEIRGEVGINLNANDALSIGCTLGTMLKTKNQRLVIVGQDNRATSSVLESEICRGLAATGCYVMRTLVAPTPALLQSAHFLKGACVMISGGSHSENINGFQIFIDGLPIRGERLKRIAALAANGSWHQERGGVINGDVLGMYMKKLKQHVKPKRKLKIAWDLCSGTACCIIPSISDAIKGEHLFMHETLDATFNHMPPDAFQPERVKVMQQVVESENCDFGFIINADGTQLAMVDDSGVLWQSEWIYLLLIRYVLEQHKDALIMLDMSSGLLIQQETTQQGSAIGFAPSGITGMLQQMIQQHAALGSDGNGRYAFGEKIGFVPCFDAILASIILINLRSSTSKTLAEERLAWTMTLYRIVEYYTCPNPENLITELRIRMLRRNVPINDLDGLRLDTPEGWWWVKHDIDADHPRIALKVEGKDKVSARLILQEAQSLIKSTPSQKVQEYIQPNHQTKMQGDSKGTNVSSLQEISDSERDTIEFTSRHWRSLRKEDNSGTPITRKSKRPWKKST